MSKEEEKRGKELLDKYYATLASTEKMAVADALDTMQKISEELVDYITDVIYWE